ncbi:cytochrome p450 [Moniliophthora roreri MCA 2997]|uniref:Cytochrome p450 n=1 Tax=Moniliophthora roreri (strain MCA 2997) TaxID=1381753 RepID=V2XFV7_MONRO|nr:cytochrome p450 [Moniliophthora roreri MCA 2997]
MEREGASLVDRPTNISGGETLSGGMRTLLVPAGHRIRKLRKALHAELQPKMAASYEPIQLRYARRLVLSVMDNPAVHQSHCKSYAASVIMTLTYGKATPSTYTDPDVQQVNQCLARLGQVLRPGTYLVDTFPVLRYVPFYLSRLKRDHQVELNLFRSQLNGVRNSVDAGKEVPASFAKYLLEHQKEYGLNDDETAYLAGSMFGAGSDTSAAAISIMMMAAASFPEAQARVQEELDKVVGSNRYPTFADEPDLPQVTAFYLECYRWRPVSVNGFAHRATNDITWRQYRIPAGAIVMGSHWCIFHDPEIFTNPDEFDPQRWMDPKTGKIRDDLRNFNFGFGRRVCPGQHVANRSVFINTALVLWAFKISQDPAMPIDIMAFTETVNIHPLPFKLIFELRSLKKDGIRELLAEETGL